MRIGRLEVIGGTGSDGRTTARRVEPIARTAAPRRDAPARDEAALDAAFVPDPQSDPRPIVRYRLAAAFAAQLIAARDGFAETRRTRVESPSRAARAYGDAMETPRLLFPGALVDVAR